jgi:CRP-like cAMP-binding protein
VTTFATSSLRSVLLSGSEGNSLHKLRRGNVLFKQQQEAISVFYIETGLVKLTRGSDDGKRLITSVAGAHRLIGEECLLQGAGTYHATSVCITDVTGHHIPEPVLKRVLGIPEFAAALVSYLIACNHDVIRRIELLALHDVEHRVLHGLAALASMVKAGQDGYSYSIPMTQAEIASYIGATRETTSSILSSLKKRQLLTVARRMVTTVSPAKLIAAANDRINAASDRLSRGHTPH